MAMLILNSRTEDLMPTNAGLFFRYSLCCFFVNMGQSVSKTLSPENWFQHWEDWENASALAKAFTIGASEARAVSNLQSRVAAPLLAELKSAVSKRGMRTFLTHDALAEGLFNVEYTSGVGSCEAWNHALTNSESLRLVTWHSFCLSTFVGSNPKNV